MQHLGEILKMPPAVNAGGIFLQFILHNKKKNSYTYYCIKFIKCQEIPSGIISIFIRLFLSFRESRRSLWQMKGFSYEMEKDQSGN